MKGIEVRDTITIDGRLARVIDIKRDKVKVRFLDSGKTKRISVFDIYGDNVKENS